MLRFARFTAAVFCFPLVWALCRTFVDAVCISSEDASGFFSKESIALFSGFAAFLLLYRVIYGLNSIYVLGHELTHAVWGIAFGAKVSGLKVRSTGGSVTLSKSNVWITLAPYFFPFWTAVVALIALVVKGIMYFACPDEPFPLPWLWMFAVGFTWCFHACFTLRSLMQRQPDVQEYGRVFSWTFIFVCNILCLLAWMLCTSDIPIKAVMNSFAGHTASAYGSVANALAEFAHWAIDFLSGVIRSA
jgi:hypothetical protein